jgi:hypothetical protein
MAEVFKGFEALLSFLQLFFIHWNFQSAGPTLRRWSVGQLSSTDTEQTTIWVDFS